MRLSMVGLLILLPTSAVLGASTIVKRSLWAADALRPYIPNGGLEAAGPKGQGFRGWRRSEQGYDVDLRVRHGGRVSARCRNTSTQDARGLSHVVELNQRTPTPVIVECWSKADGVSAGGREDYSLHVGGIDVDGSRFPAWSAPFKSGTYGWQRCTLTIVPRRPIKQLGVSGILRNRTGTAWFDDFQLWTLPLPAGTKLFDGLPVAAPAVPSGRPTPGPSISTEDGLELRFDERTGHPVTVARGGFFWRDAGGLSHFFQPSGTLTQKADGAIVFEGDDDVLKLHLSAAYRTMGGAIRVDATVRDLTGADRAVTVYFTYPLDAVGWLWHDDQRVARRIEVGQTYHNYVGAGAGVNGMASRYPFACISGQRDALVIGAPLDVPRLYRFGYDADSRELYAAVDLGLSPETEKFPSEASFSLVLYRCDPAWGFRSALKRYYKLFPHCFTKRNKREGMWMAPGDVEGVEGFEDFGFQFKTPNDKVHSDERHGIYSFVYTSPKDLGLRMPPEMERTTERALAHLKARIEAGSRGGRAVASSVIENANHEWDCHPVKAPWCDGFKFAVNPSPNISNETPDRFTQWELFWRRVEYAVRRADNPRGAWRNWDDGASIWQDGYSLAPGAGRAGSCAVKLGRRSDEDDAGATQSVQLEQKEPRPLTARVWTRAANVTGKNDKKYGLLLEAEADYADGAPLQRLMVVWARTGTHDWELLERTIVPPEPIRSLHYHLLFREPHTGTVWFDDAFLGEEGSEDNLLQDADFEPDPQAPRSALDGTYIDSSDREWRRRNYRREHWAAADGPLVFDSEGRVCQWMVLPRVAFLREMAKRMWRAGMMTMSNGAPRTGDLPWAVAWLDVLGQETNWAPDGEYAPEPDAVMSYSRALAYQRPILLHVHVQARDFEPEWVELCMKRSTAYGFFPGMGANLGPGLEREGRRYFEKPRLYNRDRELHKKYIPVVKALSAAGWEPVTYARSDNAKVYVERFGRPGGPLYLTLFNDSHERQIAMIALDVRELGLEADGVSITEVLSGESMSARGGHLGPLSIQPEDVKVLRLTE